MDGILKNIDPAAINATANEQEQQLDPAAMDATAEEQEQQLDPAAMDATAKEQQQSTNTTTTTTIDNLWKDNIAGGGITHQYHQPSFDDIFSAHSGGDDVTFADFMARVGAVPAPFSSQQYPCSDTSESFQVATGKQKAVEETLELDKAAQKQKSIIKNRESAKSRECKKAVVEKPELDKVALQKQEGTTDRREYYAMYREQKKARLTELEDEAKDLDIETKRLLDQAERLKRFEQLRELYNPNMEQRSQLRSNSSY